MSAPLDEGLELLDRSLAYTLGCLLDATPAHLHRPTPCTAWDLDQLLAHLDDGLDAFTEGARGVVAVVPTGWTLEARVARLQVKACRLLGAWTAPGTPAAVRVGGVAVETGVVVRAAALEIAVHGWDVGRATGRGGPLPEALARALRPVAAALVAAADRPVRFAPAVRVAPHDGHAAHLLGHLGRDARAHLTGPPPGVWVIRGTADLSAS